MDESTAPLRLRVLTLGLFALFSCAPASLGEFFGRDSAWPEVISKALLVIFALLATAFNLAHLRWARFDRWPLVAIVGVVLMVTLSSVANGVSAKLVGVLLTFWLALLVVGCIERERVVPFLVRVGLAACLLSIFLVLLVPSLGTMQTVEHAGQWRGIFPHKNILGSYGCLFTAIALLGRDRSSRVLLVIAPVCVVASLSATAIGCLLLMGILSLVRLLQSRLTRRQPRTLALTLWALVICGCGLFTQDQFLETMGRDSGLTGRTELWKSVGKAIIDRPVFGFGIGNFWKSDGPVDTYVRSEYDAFKAEKSHNGYLELLLETGWVTAIPLGLAVLLRLLRNGEGERAWHLTVIAVLVLSATELNLIDSQFSTSILIIALISNGVALPVGTAIDRSGRSAIKLPTWRGLGRLPH